MDPVTLARSGTCSVARPLRSSKKPKPSRWLDRDGERVITKVVAGTRSVLNLRDPQVEGRAGGRNHLDLHHNEGRSVGAADPHLLAPQLLIVAQASNFFRLLFQAVA
jgi:hypothetical protein